MDTMPHSLAPDSETSEADGPLDYPINPAAYQWTGRFMRFLRRVLKVNIKLHHDQGQVEAGDIFVFNHFARFETFIPQYLFWEHCGAICRSIADRDLFRGGEKDRFGNFLRGVGAVPNDHPNLLALLAAEVMRGRKVIVFPEGGMVKDRQVLGEDGDYSVYSRSASRRRKQHSGAAVIAMALEVFKAAVRHAAEHRDTARLDNWCELLGMPDHGVLLARAERPTQIVPANITFYPLRVGDNALQRGVELFNRGISPRMREELLVEGNILLEDTDMDIRLGRPLRPADFWNEHERAMVAERAARLGGLRDAFTTHAARSEKRLYANAGRLHAESIRDAYMHGIYQLVTVHLSHLAAVACYQWIAAGRQSVPKDEFHRALYLAVKQLQVAADVNLHRGLRNPESYADLPAGKCAAFDQFVRTAVSLGLMEVTPESYRFLPKLAAAHDFDRVRLENPLAVYANEVAPAPAVAAAVAAALGSEAGLTDARLAELHLDDERRALSWDWQRFRKPEHLSINALQTQEASAEPFFLEPPGARPLGVLLVHGFLAGPAEMRGLGEALAERGFASLGVRLKGHGTSPWDLRSRTWEDWLESVKRGYGILARSVERICIVGFSMGGSLALVYAAERPAALAGVAAIAAPMRFRDRNMAFVPMVHGANRLVGAVRETGVMAFRPNAAEHPHINYRHMPIRALYELGRLVDHKKKRLRHVHCPALVIQGDADPVVTPASGALLYRKLGSPDKRLCQVPSDRHGIVYGNVGHTWAETLAFIERLAGR